MTVAFTDLLDRVAQAWGKAIQKDRDIWFLVALFASSMVAFLPFSRDTSISNFLVYALLPMILVFANKKTFSDIPSPTWKTLPLAVAIIVGSFVFNWLSGLQSGNYSFGLTDYVILVVGVFALFYSIDDSHVIFGVVLLVVVRGITLGLGLASTSLFNSVSSFFVWIVILISKVFVSPGIHEGSIPGRIVVGGASHNSEVGIGWACAGLEELVIISVIIFILIDSFKLGRARTTIWLAVGIAGSFVINIVRMVILVWVAFEYGMSRMLWVHTHIGDILFLVWIGIFWIVFFKLAVPAKSKPPDGEPVS
jgi:exosortase/archaeosortase family protein